MSKWYTTLAAVQIADPNFDASTAPAGARPGIVEVPAGRAVELDADTAKALDKHNAIREASKGEITDEQDRREREGDLASRMTLSAARGGMVPVSDNRAIRQSTGNEAKPVAQTAQTGGGKPRAGAKSPDEGKSGDELL